MEEIKNTALYRFYKQKLWYDDLKSDCNAFYQSYTTDVYAFLQPQKPRINCMYK